MQGLCELAQQGQHPAPCPACCPDMEWKAFTCVGGQHYWQPKYQPMQDSCSDTCRELNTVP